MVGRTCILVTKKGSDGRLDNWVLCDTLEKPWSFKDNDTALQWLREVFKVDQGTSFSSRRSRVSYYCSADNPARFFRLIPQSVAKYLKKEFV